MFRLYPLPVPCSASAARDTPRPRHYSSLDLRLELVWDGGALLLSLLGVIIHLSGTTATFHWRHC